jgi:hypothetical protein
MQKKRNQKKSAEKTAKKTVGAHAVELQQKQPETRDPVEIQKNTEQDYIKNLIKCVQDNKRKYAGDFFVVVISKNEKLLYNVIRCYFFDRVTCPTPDYDQTLFMYSSSEESIKHIWTVPDKETCLLYIQNKDKIPPAEYPLLENVLKFRSGELFRLCKKFNNEEADSPLLVSQS